MTTILPPAELGIDELAATVRGPVLAGDHPDATGEITTFNLAVTHRPDVVVGATCAEDVAAAVAWAADKRLPVAVQATGHGPVRSVESGVLISTGRMQSVSVDPVRRTATVAAGVRWSDVLPAAAAHGLAPLSGSSSHVGVVGYTLGGGMGCLAREHGFAADHVHRIEVVTADGRIRSVDADSDPDLFWALRGGKGNLGIVTALEFGLVPVTDIYGGGVFFQGTSAASVLHAFREWAPALPERATASVALMRIPPLEELPEMLRGQFVVHLRFAYNGPADEGERLLAPMLAAGEVLLPAVGPMPYAQADLIHQDPTDPLPAWERGRLVRELTDRTVEALLGVAGPGVETPLLMVELRLMGGALGRPAAVPNAVGGREAAYSLFLVAPLLPGLEEAVPAAGDQVVQALSPWLTGTAQLNFLGDAHTPEAVAAAWDPTTHARLLEVKRRVDPDDLFCFGHALTARA